MNKSGLKRKMLHPVKPAKARRIMNILNELYPDPPIPLKHQDAYTLLVAVVLSAQCTDKRVNEVTPHLFALAKTPGDMAKLSVRQIRSIIKPCGLSPTKSKNIRALSQIIVKKCQGKVPQSFVELEKLPGVGHKTASVVMAQAFGKNAFPVDTHIHRLACRWGLSSGKSVKKTEEDLKSIFPEYAWNKLHLQMIYFGRQYCPARNHRNSNCPICSLYGDKK